MATAYKSVGALVASSGTSLAVPLPAVVAGDYGVMDIYIGASATPPTIAGWTLTPGASYSDGGTGARHQYYRTFSGTAGATTVNVTVAAGGAYAKIGLATGAGSGPPTPLNNPLTALGYWQSSAITTGAAALAFHFGFILAVRTQGTLSNQGTITSTNTSRAFEGILSVYQLETVSSAITSSSGGSVRGTFAGGNANGWTLSAILPNLNTGTAASVLPALTQSGAGTFTPPTATGTAASVLPALTQSAAGTFDEPVYTGAGASVLPALTQSGAGTFTAPAYTGSAASTLPALTQSGAGTFSPPGGATGTAASILPALTQQAAGTYTGPPAYTGTAASVLPALTQEATGSYTPPGGYPTIPARMTLEADGAELTLDAVPAWLWLAADGDMTLEVAG